MTSVVGGFTKHKQAYKKNMEGNEILSEATEIDITKSKKENKT